MHNFYLHLIANLIFTTATTADDVPANTDEIVDRQLPSGQLAVTASVGAEDLYARIKTRFPHTYVDSAEWRGPLRGEDYFGMYLGTIQYGMLPLKHPFVHESPASRKERDQDLADKSRICARVFASPLFEIYDEEVVNFDLETMEPAGLLQHDQNAYEEMYRVVEGVANPHHWLNPYSRRDVTIDDGAKFGEYVFRCITRKRSASAVDTRSSYKTYFVSPIYRSWYPENSTMVGRFVFSDDLRVFALAEEPAIIDNNIIGKTQRAYFDVYEERIRAENAHSEENLPHPEDKMSNVVCRLSVPDKIRFCAIVLSAIDFPEKVVFQPLEESVEAECAEKSISSSTFRVERKPEKPWYTYAKFEPVRADVRIAYREWVIGCKATGPNSGTNAGDNSTYYVSRGVDVYTAIVYRSIGEELYSPYVGVDCVHLVQGTEDGAKTKRFSVTFESSSENER